MARTVGDGEEVKELAQKLKNCLEEIKQLNGKGQALLNQLSDTSKDNSLRTSEDIVNEVASIVKSGLPECAETAQKVNAYGDFLVKLAQS